MKPAAKKTARNAAPRAAKTAPRSKMSPAEIKRLVCAARHAWQIQDPGISFDDWRHEQVMEAVGLPGLSKCGSDHFCELMGRFETAAGNEEQALYWYLRGAKNRERQLAHSIVGILREHIHLATASEAEIVAGTAPKLLARRLEKRAAILDHWDGHITPAYLAAIVADKTRRPGLTLDLTDLATLEASLAERCDATQLAHVRFTLVNRIAEREGTGRTADRNRSQASPEAKAARDPNEIDTLRW